MTPTTVTSESPTTRSVEENPPKAEGHPWPEHPWDGLSDEQGPIPAFGPVITDTCGRIVMSEEERVARKDAVLRMLAVIRDITDESDTDELWDEVTRALEGPR
jgi:hypothetical protein